MNPGIELFRGIAALMVLAAHYEHFLFPQQTLLHYLSTGVDCFFVISGFVFAQAILGSKEVVIGKYLARRFFRIYPLYLFSLLLYFLAAEGRPERLHHFFTHLFMLHTTRSPQEASFFHGAYWTLPVEAEFYALVPALAWCFRKSRALAAVLLGISLLLPFALMQRAAPLPQINGASLTLFHLPGILIEFFFGVALFRICQGWKARTTPITAYTVSFLLAIAIFSLLVAYLAHAGYRETDIIRLRVQAPLFALSCAAGYTFLLFPFVHFLAGSRTRFTVLCVASGALSYGIYLFHGLAPQILTHWPMLPSRGLSAFALCTATTVVLAAVAHVAIESPFRSFGRNLFVAKDAVPAGGQH